ncbi:unnamed protein product [Parascedosporium putredinis]|uniref:Alpha/beta hydrolase fold-3 domain-containing protein n=1 Tax=Parascedosporium putredinis TaxID=1442378 RepID=A0A9P1H187_9PEZI|nr:unnamed protein product [Parascedosporium putredinis]CAI7993441.1 unnamed protein product [Parascedosporium putredinis]
MPRFAKVEGIPVPLADPEQSMEASQIGPHETPSVAVDKTGPRPRVRRHVAALPGPAPPAVPAFTKTVRSTMAKNGGEFILHFYTPKGYENKFLHRNRLFPAVINFHGGGFTLGNATDDARFARFALPEHPFPVAVDDGADAILYVVENAADLHINPMLLATSGFSAGGNLAVTCPMRLVKHMKSIHDPERQVPGHRIVASALWYPITDYTLTRAERRASSSRPDQALPPYLTDLFDQSYLYPPDLDLADPYLSPPARPTRCSLTALGAEPINKEIHYKMIKGVTHGWDKSPNPMSVADQSEELYKECCGKLKAIFMKEVHRVDGALPLG